MKILVTGAAGFIGGHLCERLLACGHDVIAIDNLSTGLLSNLAKCTSNRFLFIQHDICEPIPIVNNCGVRTVVLDTVDAIMHLASPASPLDYLKLPIETLAVGAMGTMNVLDFASHNHACRIIFTSTSEVYGDPLVDPQPEQYWGNVNPIGVRSVYDEAKRYAEALLTAHHRARGVDVRIARLFNTYGPRMRPFDGRVMSNFITQALRGDDLTIHGDGSQRRSFCYVDDTVRALIALLMRPESGEIHAPINIGNPQPISIAELANLIIQLTGSTSGVRHLDLPSDDPKLRCPVIERAKTLLQWKPEIDLVNGIHMMIADMKTDGAASC